MRRITHIIIICFCLFQNALFLKAQSPTINIVSHDNVDMTWYGNYDRTALFPPDTLSYNKILLHYTMGCASAGCSAWDYTTKIEILRKTGTLDSTLSLLPSFTVDGNTLDSLHFSFTETFQIVLDSLANEIDTLLNSQLTVLLFDNSQNPPLIIDTLYVWQASYYYYLFDSLFNIIDSVFVSPDSSLFQNFTNHYDVWEVKEPFELARVITPYGGYMANNTNGYNSAWKHKHTFDITDFAIFFHDSVTIRAFYDGWSSGFSATLEFEMVLGTPPREVIDIKNIYRGSYAYNSSSQFESEFLVPINVFIPQNVEGAKLRVIPTGHGFDNNVNCAEFCPRDYYVRINDDLKYTQSIWRDDCGLNPIYPQGGTWLYDRANWCPGSRAHIFEHELTSCLVQGDSLKIDIDLQNYTWSGNQVPSYYFTTQLIKYADYNLNIDAGIEDILSPNIADDHKRYNPICANPEILIKNYGKLPITSFVVNFNVKGAPVQTFNWSGIINQGQNERIVLPNLNTWDGSENVFEVNISNVNAGIDDNMLNNSLSSHFNTVPIYESETIILEFKTNNIGHHTSWTIEDENENVLYSGENYPALTTYRDTMALTEGCYVLKFNDSGKNGLSFWANNEGSGFVRLRKMAGGYFKVFNADFGTQITHHFRTSSQTFIHNKEENKNIRVFPNPSKGDVTIDFSDFLLTDVKLELFNYTSQLVMANFFVNTKENSLLQIDNLTKGVYILLVKTKRDVYIEKIVIL